MTRTDAISFIEDLLIDIEERCPNSSANEKAQMILSEVEHRIGMLPPTYVNPLAKDDFKREIKWSYLKYLDKYGSNPPYKYFIENEWEPEND